MTWRSAASGHRPVYDAGMQRSQSDSLLDAVAATAQATVGLDLLILFGSRARGDARPGADWDFGYLADEVADVSALLAALVEVLDNDHIDLVDSRSRQRSAALSGGVRRTAGVRGQVRPVRYHYRLQAAQFWCDNAPVFELGYEDILEALRP